jgi:hypothetical protein
MVVRKPQYSNSNDGVRQEKYCPLFFDFRIVPTMWYFRKVPTMWYFFVFHFIEKKTLEDKKLNLLRFYSI